MEQQPSSARIALKWGVIGGLVSIIFATALYMTELWKNGLISSLVGILPMVVFLFLAAKEFRTENNGFLSFGEGLSVSMLTGAIYSLLGNLYAQLYQKIIDPGFVDKMKDFQFEKLEEQGLSEEQIEQAMELTSKFSTGGLSFLIGLLGSLLFAFIIALIISAILKKNKPVF
jgi:hypothetical protein